MLKMDSQKFQSFKASLASADINYDADVDKMEIPDGGFFTTIGLSDENIPETIWDMIVALHQHHPVMALIPAYMVGFSSNHNISIVIWGIQNGKYVCTNTFGTQRMTFDPYIFNKNIKCAWIL